MIYVLGFSLVEIAVVVAAVGSTALGLYIGFQAYRGLRRHDSRPMQFLSIGLLLLTAVTYSVALAGTLLLRLEIMPLPMQDYFRLLVRFLQLAGLFCIAYSLHIRGRS